MVKFDELGMEQFLRTFSIEDFIVSPDEKQIVFSTNLSGKFNLWGMDLPSQFPKQLTFKDQSCNGLVYDKKGQFIIAGFDRDGDENTQFYALPPKGGQLKEVVFNEGTRNSMPKLSKDGTVLYYTSSKDNPTFLNAYAHNLETGHEEMIIEGDNGIHYLFSLSPNEESYLYLKMFANTYSLMYVKHKGKDILLTPETEGQYTVSGGCFVSDNLIYFLTNHGEEFSYVASFDLETETFRKVVSVPQEEFKDVSFDKAGNQLYLVAEKGVEDRLYTFNLETNELKGLSIPYSVVDKLVVLESGSVYTLGRSATSPSNIYRLVQDGWEKVTDNVVPGIEEDEMIEPEVITYKSFDGLEIESLFFKANPEKSNGEIIFWPHGGPQASERKTFRASFQFFLNQGFSLFAPNFRGSTGYGLEFAKMVEGDWGNGPRLDNVAGMDWLIEQGYTSKGNILLMGGSYGGYMALLLHGRHADYFKAVVDISGPSDLFSFIDSVPEDWKPVMDQWVGNPEKDREKLIEYSPITYVDGMSRPMLIIQGANDPRVVKAESDKIYEALKNKGTDVEYMLLEDEGHGFSKKTNEIAVYQRILDFFMEQLSK